MGIELNGTFPGHHRAGKATTVSNALDGLGAADSLNGFAGVMSLLAIGKQPLPPSDWAAQAAASTSTSDVSTGLKLFTPGKSTTSKQSGVQAKINLVANASSEGSLAADQLSGAQPSLAVQPDPEELLTPPDSVDPAAIGWRAFLTGDGSAGAVALMSRAAAESPSQSPGGPGPELGAPKAAKPDVTDLTAGGAARALGNDFTSQRGLQSVSQSQEAASFSDSTQPGSSLGQSPQLVQAMSSSPNSPNSPSTQFVFGKDGQASPVPGAADQVLSELPRVASEASDQGNKPIPLAASQPNQPTDTRPSTSDAGTSTVVKDAALANLSVKLDPTDLSPMSQPKTSASHGGQMSNLSGMGSGQHVNTSQLGSQRPDGVPTLLAANNVMGRMDQPVVQVTEKVAKPFGMRLGTGGEGVYGQAPSVMSSAVDVNAQVVPSSAVIADGALAETVTYWATHGVQNATMQLDGLGSDPVEVHISMNGDMAQVDFRTNQPEVRLAIEAAAGQLKDMLSSQGLQLAGMSIGHFGQGGQTDQGSQQGGEARKMTVADSNLAVEPQRGRSVNLSVGQSLDLFV